MNLYKNIVDSSCIRFNNDTDHVEIFNRESGSWVEWQKTGLTGEQSTLIVTTRNLNGGTVECIINGNTYTGTFVGGSCVFTIPYEGKAIVRCGSYQKEVTLANGVAVQTELTRTPATLTITTGNLNGETVTVQIGGVTYTGILSGGRYVFTVYEIGVAVVTCSVLSDEITLAEGGSYTIDFTRPCATLNLTTEDLNGEVVTVSVNGKVYQGLFIDNACTVVVFEGGNATIVCSETTVTRNIVIGEVYNIEINDRIPVYYVQNGVANANIDISSFAKSGNMIYYQNQTSSKQNIQLRFNNIDADIVKGKTVVVVGDRMYCPNVTRLKLRYYINNTSTDYPFVKTEDNTFECTIGEDFTYNKSYLAVVVEFSSGNTAGIKDIYII